MKPDQQIPRNALVWIVISLFTLVAPHAAAHPAVGTWRLCVRRVLANHGLPGALVVSRALGQDGPDRQQFCRHLSQLRFAHRSRAHRGPAVNCLCPQAGRARSPQGRLRPAVPRLLYLYYRVPVQPGPADRIVLTAECDGGNHRAGRPASPRGKPVQPQNHSPGHGHVAAGPAADGSAVFPVPAYRAVVDSAHQEPHGEDRCQRFHETRGYLPPGKIRRGGLPRGVQRRYSQRRGPVLARPGVQRT